MNKALIVIDVQVGIIDGFQAYRGSAVLERINILRSRARAASVPVIYVQHDGAPGDPLEVSTLGWQIHPAVAPGYGETVIRKRAADSFFETTVKRELDARGVDHLILTGCQTEYCVDTTSRSAVAHGYDVTLVSDAHTTIDSRVLKAEQIIAHHNALLDGFDAGRHIINVRATND